MLHYILQTVAFQLFFLIIYDVFLKKETFFNWNRAYLLTTAILSLALPFIKINKLKEIVPEEFVIRLPEVIIGNLSASQIDTAIIAQQTQQQSNFVWSWELLLFGGMLIATVFLVFKIGKLLWMIYNNPKRWKGNILIIKLLKSNAAFSFFHYIFLGEHIKSEERETIISHELIHVKHKHTLDLLFFEIMRIVFWFNPLIYMYQNRIATLHEYIADAKTIKEQGKKEYYQSLLSQVFETQNISFVNTFFKQSLIKKRILMLSKTKSKQILKVKYALLIPVILTMLIYTSCTKQEVITEREASISEQVQTLKESLKGGEINENDVKELRELIRQYELAKNSKTGKDETMIVKIKDTIWIQATPIYDLFINDLEPSIGIPFNLIDEVPTFTFCKALLTNKERKKCMSENIAKHVNRNFNTDLATSLGLEGRIKIYTIFKIDTLGNVVGVKARAPHPDLEAEAKRVIGTLPQFIPGKQKGKAVVVTYSLPILFEIKE